MSNSEKVNNSGKSKIWNVPNALTVFRMILIIPFVIVLLGGKAGWFGDNSLIVQIVSVAIFVVASLTDLIDGKVARKYNLVTNFGKFMDPLADKILVCSALICLTALEKTPAWVVIVIIAREFIISGFRLVASDAGIVIAASYWGKWKTTFQMTYVILMLIDLGMFIPFYGVVCMVVMYISVSLTIISLVDYIIKNKSVILN